MDRGLFLYLAPLLPLVVGAYALQATLDPGSPVALLLYPLAALLAPILALTLPKWNVKKNPFAGGPIFYLLGFFNLLLIFSIIIEVLALFTLFDLISPELSPTAVWFVWMLPSVLLALHAVILLERRANAPPPTHERGPLIVAGVLTVFNVVLWTNALFAGHATFLFVTDIALAPEQSVYLLLTGATLQAVVSMILFRIPTMFELIFARDVGPTRLKALTMASPITFTLSAAGLALGGSFLFILAADRLFHGGGVLPDSFALRLALAFPIALVTFFVVAAVLTLRHAKPRYKHKLDAEQKVLMGLQIGSALVTFGLVVLAFKMSQGLEIPLGAFTIPSTFYNEVLVLAILSATGPLGFYLQAQNRKLQYLEERLPDFLTDLAETSKAGLPLHLSLESAARKDYGPLSVDIQRMSLQCSWGLSFAEAFKRFGERSKSVLIRRSAQLVVETSQSGGNTGDVLGATARDIQAQKALDADRRGAMGTYIAVIYVVFFVFVGVLASLAQMFLPQIIASGKSAAEAGAAKGLFGGSRINLYRVRELFFQSLLVQAAGNGFIAGLVRDGNVGVGMRHVFVLTLVAYASFRFLLL